MNKYELLPEIQLLSGKLKDIVRYKTSEEVHSVLKNVLCNMGIINERYRVNDLNVELSDAVEELTSMAMLRGDGWFKRNRKNYSECKDNTPQNKNDDKQYQQKNNDSPEFPREGYKNGKIYD